MNSPAVEALSGLSDRAVIALAKAIVVAIVEREVASAAGEHH